MPIIKNYIYLKYLGTMEKVKDRVYQISWNKLDKWRKQEVENSLVPGWRSLNNYSYVKMTKF